MRLYCDYCGYYVNAETFKRTLDIKKQITKEEYYCPECLGTIFIKEKESKLKEK